MPPPNEDVTTVFGALMMMGILPIAGVIEVIGGILLLINKQTGVAIFFLAPVAFCAFMFHLMLDPAGIGGATFFLLATAFLAYSQKVKFLGMMD
jgi:hypothetical protein